MDNVVDKRRKVKIFILAYFNEYHVNEALYMNENSGSSSLGVVVTDVGGLTTHIKDEVAHKKGSTRIILVVRPMS